MYAILVKGIIKTSSLVLTWKRAFLRTLEAKGFPWSPHYRGSSLTFDNPIEYPFVVLDWAEGNPLKWDDNFPSQPIRDSLLAQIAEIQQSLIMCTLETRMC